MLYLGPVVLAHKGLRLLTTLIFTMGNPHSDNVDLATKMSTGSAEVSQL